MIKVSIIIPVYNAEVYLKRCIDSVLSQTERNIEVVLIDDGSMDESLIICKKYEEQDSRVKVIHQKNAGVSAARNMGISIARGEYIGFVDSDDWIDSEMYEEMLNEANRTDADVVMCDVRTVYDDGKIQADTITQLSSNQILKKSDFTPSLLLEMAGSACRCIYKNNRYNDKLQNRNTVLFPLDVKFSEDRIFNLYAFGQANKVAYMKKALYNRYMNKKSAVHRFHKDYFEAYKKSADGIEHAIIYAWQNDAELQRAYLGQFISGAISSICNYYYKTSPLTVAERKKLVRDLCEDVQLRDAIQTYGIDRKTKLILNRHYSLLIAYAKLANLKHRR